MNRVSHQHNVWNLNIYSKLVTSLVATAIVAGAGTADATLIAYWKFDRSNLLTDSSGNGHTLVAAPTTATPSGGAGVGNENTPSVYTTDHYTNPNNLSGSTSSASFDGTDAVISTNTLGLNGYTQITLEWFERSTSSTSELYPWFSGNPADINGATGGFSFASQGTFRDFGAANLSTTVPQNEWHEYALTLDTAPGGGGMTLYKDYVQVDHTATAAASFINTDFVFGKDYYPAERRFQGQIDNFSISSGILDPSQFVSAQSTVPEPSSLFILSLGAIGLWAAIRKRRGS